MPPGLHDALFSTMAQSSLLLLVGALFMLLLRRAGMPGGWVGAACAGGIVGGVLLGPSVLGKVRGELYEDLAVGGRSERMTLQGEIDLLTTEVEALRSIGVTPAAVTEHVMAAGPKLRATELAYQAAVSRQHVVRAMVVSGALGIIGVGCGRRLARRKLAMPAGLGEQRPWMILAVLVGAGVLMALRGVPLGPLTLLVHLLPVSLGGVLWAGDLVPGLRSARLSGFSAGLSVIAVLALAQLAGRMTDPLVDELTMAKRWLPITGLRLLDGTSMLAVGLGLTTLVGGAALGAASSVVIAEDSRIRHGLRGLGILSVVLLSGQAASRAPVSDGVGTLVLSTLCLGLSAMLPVLGAGVIAELARRRRPWVGVSRFAWGAGVSLAVLGGAGSLLATDSSTQTFILAMPLAGGLICVCTATLRIFSKRRRDEWKRPQGRRLRIDEKGL